MRRVAILHTNFGIVELMNRLAAEHLPGVEIVNIVDDSLLIDARRTGMDAAMIDRLRGYYRCAAASGAEVILNSCSSVGAAVDQVRDELPVPLVKIDRPLAEHAVRSGPRIAVIATVESTLAPTTALLQATAGEFGLAVEIDAFLCAGGLEMYLAGDIAGHNACIVEAAEKAASGHDVIVLAQASMSGAANDVAAVVDVPVLSSPELALAEVRRLLDSER